MKKISKAFSIIFALTMLFSTFANLKNITFAVDPHKTKVIVHKILMNEQDLTNFDFEAAQRKLKYEGNAIDKNQYQNYFGNSAKEIAGVNFKVWKKVTRATGSTKTGVWLGLLGETDNYELVNTYAQGKNTETNGADFELEDGTYIFVEDKTASSYYSSPDGKELTQSKAVPFKLSLPITKPDGSGLFDVGTPLHVYPKNTENKPDIVKKFTDTTEMKKNVEIGKAIPYTITTKVPVGASYETFVWEDEMLKGLDFDTTTSVTLNSTQVTLANNTDYTVTSTKRGFSLVLNTSGLTKLKDAAKNKEVTMTLTYQAILNDSAVVETDIPNKVRLHYGNRPNQISTPKALKPKNGQINIEKRWDNGVEKKPVEFGVYEVETGIEVKTVTIQVNQTTATFDGLDANKDYIVIEKTKVNNSLPSYENSDGKVTITNKKNPNPTPIEPEDPKVRTYGKQFIKTNNEEKTSSSLEKLAGAEFVVMKNNQYLALKSQDQQQAQLTTYQQAEEAYKLAVKNKEAQDQIATKKTARDNAYAALNMQWQWVSSIDNAFKFISSATTGYFEVKGLEPGTYHLKETKAPEGYALITDSIEFTVSDGSWNDTQGIDGHTPIKNKKVVIPQTGGIGTIIFTIGGLSIMAFALVGMTKRKNKEEK